MRVADIIQNYQPQGVVFAPRPAATAALGLGASSYASSKYICAREADPKNFAVTKSGMRISTPATTDGVPYHTARYCFPFDINFNLDPADADVINTAPVEKPMRLRSTLANKLASVPGNWNGNICEPRGWDHGEIAWAIARTRAKLEAAGKNPSRLVLVTNPSVRLSSPLRGLLTHVVDGMKLEYRGVEKFVWGDNFGVLCYVPVPDEPADGATIYAEFVPGNRLEVEVKPDRDNNRSRGRIVEEFFIRLDPTYGMLLKFTEN